MTYKIIVHGGEKGTWGKLEGMEVIGKEVMIKQLQKGVPGVAATKPGTCNDDKNFTLHGDYIRICGV